MQQRSLRQVAVIGGLRIPFCRVGTNYADASNRDMLEHTLGALVERDGLSGERLGEVALGAVMKHSSDWNLAREVVLSSGLSPATPGITLQRACGTSLDAAIVIANRIACGQIDAGVAGGSDTASDVPIVFRRRFARRLLKASRAKSFMDRLRAFRGFRPSELRPDYPAVSEPRTGLSMGEHTEKMAKDWGISREAQDRYALESHRKAARAYEAGFFDDLVVPFRGAKRDNILRPDTTMERLASLKPAFDRTDAGTLTAGNSTPLTDGASCALLATDEWARAHDMPVQAYLTHARVAAVDFVGGEGLLMAPPAAIAAMLADAGLALQDFDVYEVHEAFAAQVLCTLEALRSDTYCREKLGLDAPLGEIDPDRLNVNGSSLALGHPFAATGTRILATAAKLLAQKGRGRALISVCTAGGMGVTAILER